ncbi:hypothetical protein J437_LFUL012585 [Ladona fulva]|uniref:Receptor ligand binding region domain-containing protein n=1 Tax=Ladona fulva TaxID=123851 RepID=A0A8K0KHL2_LADFU|nr:hypothetical protein J437_LFUL012585 [Ladona fulva]
MRRPALPSLPLILLLPLLLREGAARVFTVGYITGSRRRPGDLEYTRPGLTISGAASLAVAENKTRLRRTSAFKANSSAENSTANQRSPHWSENPFPLVDLDETSSGLNPQVESVKVSEEEVPFETWVSSRIPEGEGHGRRWAQAQEIDYGSVVGVTAGGGMETTGGEVVSAGRVFGGDPGRVLRTLGHRLELRVAETYGEEAESIRAAARLWRDGVDAYIGPQETCLHEGRMAAAFNLPMVSYVSITFPSS